MSFAPADVVARLSALPDGTMTGTTGTRRYIASKSVLSGGHAVKLVAEEIGGGDYISLNIYHLRAGARLFPCEMPLQKVIDFVRAFTPDPPEA